MNSKNSNETGRHEIRISENYIRRRGGYEQVNKSSTTDQYCFYCNSSLKRGQHSCTWCENSD